MSRRPIAFPGLARGKNEDSRSRAQQRMDELLKRAELDRLEKGPEVPLSAADHLDIPLTPAIEASPESLALEPPAVSPWSSADGEPELRAGWNGPAPLEIPFTDADAPLGEPWDLPPDEFNQWDDLDLNPASGNPAALDAEAFDVGGFDPSTGVVSGVAAVGKNAAAEPSPVKPKPKPVRLGRRGPSADAERNVLPFKRRSQQRKIRRLRRHPLVRWLRPLAMALGILAVPALLLAWFLASPSFALTEVTVKEDPRGRVSSQWVNGILSGFEGTNIWLLPLARVETVLKSHPWVADVALRKLPPHQLAVVIVERREEALFRDVEKGLVYVDARGRLIAPWKSLQGAGDLPILSGRSEARHLAGAVALVDEIHRAGPSWAGGLSEVEILSELDYRLYTRDLPFPLLVRSGTVGEKARHLQAILPRILERLDTVAAVDLRFARRIIIEPVAQETRRS